MIETHVETTISLYNINIKPLLNIHDTEHCKTSICEKISYSTLIINNAHFVRMKRTWISETPFDRDADDAFMCRTRAVKMHRH